LFHIPSRFFLLLSIGIVQLMTISAIFYYLAACYAAFRFSQKHNKPCAPIQIPVTIVKPLYGADSNTYGALASFCRQDYPCFQIIFSVRSTADPAVSVVEQLIHHYPQLDLCLVVSDHTWGANNKVNNMANALARAKYPIYVFADSDIWVHPDYLTRTLQPLQDSQVGLITTMYRTRPAGWMAAFEALATSTEFFPSVLLAREVEGMAFAFGATVVIRRDVLECFGGLSLISNYLADDFKIGQCTANAGFKVVLSDYVVEHSLTTGSFRTLILHQLRWARGNRFSRPWGTLGLLFSYGTISSLVFLLLTHGSCLAWLLFIVTWGLRYALGWMVGVRLLHDEPASRLLWLAPVRDLVSFIIWSASWFGSEVEWNNRRLALSNGGWITERPSPKPFHPTPVKLPR
jgi:ceramide glucosyltransferase